MDVVWPSSGENIGGEVFYSEVTIEGEKFRVGDCVHVFSTPTTDPYVGRLLTLFVDVGKANTAEVQWFHTLDELIGGNRILKRRGIRQTIATYLKRIDAREKEVFAGYTEKVLLDSICGRCRIMLYCVEEKLPEQEDNVYSCRLAYDSARTRFDALDVIATRVRELTRDSFVDAITEEFIFEKKEGESSNFKSFYRRKRSFRRTFDDDDDEGDDDAMRAPPKKPRRRRIFDNGDDNVAETKSVVDSIEKDSGTKREVEPKASSKPESNDGETEAVRQELIAVDDEEEGWITFSEEEASDASASEEHPPLLLNAVDDEEEGWITCSEEEASDASASEEHPPVSLNAVDEEEEGWITCSEEEASDTSASEEHPPLSLKQEQQPGVIPEMMEISASSLSHGQNGGEREPFALIHALEDRLSKVEKDVNVCKDVVKKLKKQLE